MWFNSPTTPASSSRQVLVYETSLRARRTAPGPAVAASPKVQTHQGFKMYLWQQSYATRKKNMPRGGGQKSLARSLISLSFLTLNTIFKKVLTVWTVVLLIDAKLKILPKYFKLFFLHERWKTKIELNFEVRSRGSVPGVCSDGGKSYFNGRKYKLVSEPQFCAISVWM